MRRTALLSLLAFGLTASAQTGLTNATKENYSFNEEQHGSISGHITTTDGEAAAYVSIGIKDTKTFTATDENGYFALRGLGCVLKCMMNVHFGDR